MLKHVLSMLSLLLATTLSLQAQVTTATINGIVTDDKGEPLAGVTVVANHTPSGTYYGTSTRADGRYTVPNLRVGGPYTISLTYTGYQNVEQQGVTLSVGQKLPLDFKMLSSSTMLQEAVISASVDPVLNSRRTGAATNVSNEQLTSLPTISRSAADYTRLTPMADGFSFAGRNGQYNNFSVDGAIFNNPFGLDAATPGGQTEAQPISLDAIEQIQVSIAPYDVTQAGFTGAGVNTVTKSGTNTLHGTVFGFYRNQDMTGKKVYGSDIVVPDLRQLQTGFSLGGPIIKDKLFFFVNAEIERRSDLGSNYLAARDGLTGSNVSRVAASDMQAIRDVLKARYGYDTGDFEGYKHNTDNQKGIVKLDWNINKKHKLTATYNFLDALKQKPAHPSAIGRRGPDLTTLQFRNSGYQINNKLNSALIELKSQFGNAVANKLQAGYSAFRDTRDPFSDPFPVININNNDGIRYIVAGHEPFSIHNKLNQNVFQINDQLNVYLQNHTLTFGGAYEKFKFDNSFNLNAYGGTFGPGFASTAAFLDAVNTGAFDADVKAARDAYASLERIGEGKPGGWALAQTNVGQFALYAQDEVNITENLDMTLGLRMDLPLYFDTQTKAKETEAANCCVIPGLTYFDETGKPVVFDHSKMPQQRPLFSPRIGFNWDVLHNRSLQVRGGAGLFTGRFPFVWVGNQVANPNWYFYNQTAENFKFPQVWRNNLGVDVKLKGWVITLEGIYTKDINAMMVRNYGLNRPTAQLSGVDNRPIYQFADYATVELAPGVHVPLTSTYVFTNTNLGYQWNGSVQIQRNWNKGFYTMIGYNFNESKDASSISAEISSDAYDRNPAYGNVNQAVLSNSLYGNRHRVLGAAYKKFSYGNMATTISLFMQYAQGGRFTYTYSGDLNGDNSALNDLIYIPTDAQVDQMAFGGTAQQQAEQRTALKAYIAQDAYLNKNRGKYAGKYAILSPWYSNWDLRILQDLNLKLGSKTNTIQLSIDVLNIGNLFNSEWGVRQIPVNTQPIGVSVSNGVPTYGFDKTLTKTFGYDTSLLSRWQAQVGLRYIF
ncbi:MAG: TonB-dependent receptor [Bacteroidota bacterium]